MTATRARDVSSRDATLDAATDLISRLGYAAASISKISAACGLPASSIYWHFGSKDGIYVAVLARARHGQTAGLPDPAVAGGSPADRLDRFLAGARAHFDRHHHDVRLLLGLGML